MALRRLVIGRVWHDEDSDSTQHVEQPVSSQLDAALDQRCSEQMMLFSCSEPRPAPSRFPLACGDVCTLTSLVIGLVVDAHAAAGALDAQLFDLLLRDDLPEGFFTTIP